MSTLTTRTRSSRSFVIFLLMLRFRGFRCQPGISRFTAILRRALPRLDRCGQVNSLMIRPYDKHHVPGGVCSDKLDGLAVAQGIAESTSDPRRLLAGAFGRHGSTGHRPRCCTFSASDYGWASSRGCRCRPRFLWRSDSPWRSRRQAPRCFSASGSACSSSPGCCSFSWAAPPST